METVLFTAMCNVNNHVGVLTYGQHYDVVEESEHKIRITDDSGDSVWHYKSLFLLKPLKSDEPVVGSVDDPIQVGEPIGKIRCIKGSETITTGDIYNIFASKDDECLVENDHNICEWFKKSNFENIEPSLAHKPRLPINIPEPLRPRVEHDMDRVREILAAMSRFAAADMNIPFEWLTELNQVLPHTRVKF